MAVRRGNYIEGDIVKELKKYESDMKKAVIRLVSFHIDDLQDRAVRDSAQASRFITIDKDAKDGGLTQKVGVGGSAKYSGKDSEDGKWEKGSIENVAAYIEFGTGLSAQQILAGYPSWIVDIAKEFYENGEGTLTGKPYLYNNYLVIKENFERDLKKLLG